MTPDSKPKLLTPSSDQKKADQPAASSVQNSAPTPAVPGMAQPQVAGLHGAPTGGGSKHWIIMGILGALIIGGLVLLTTMKKEEAEDENAKAEAAAEAARNYKPEKRASVPTDERPFKNEMAKVSVSEIDSLALNARAWVWLTGKVVSSSEDGKIVFEKALGQKDPFEAQLVRGEAPEVVGKEIAVIGWLIDKGHMQIDGPEDVDVDLPKASYITSDDSSFDIYSVNDFDLLKNLIGKKLTLQGMVTEVRYSHDKEKVYLVFDAAGKDVVASGVVSHFETGMDFEAMKQYEGKMVTVRGVLGEHKWDEGYRIFVNYSRFRHINVIE